MAIDIRPAQEKDAEGMWSLIHELAIYEKSEPEHVVSPEQLRQDLENGHFFAFVAEEEGKLVGMALGYPVYSTWKGLSYYLEDIIVAEDRRRSGIGSRLFERVVEYAREKGAGRLGWQVLEWNTPAISFYQKYQAMLDPEWINCRLTQEQLQAFVLNKK